MDSPTQMLLGAAIGQTCFGHKLGRRAAWWGAVGGTIPDLDVVIIPFLGRIGEFLYHRGPTHSLVFGAVVGPLLGYAVWLGYRRKQRRNEAEEVCSVATLGHRSLLPAWIGLFVLTLMTHPLLDIFTTYGTVLFWPFSDARIALNGVAITDPAYSLILIFALFIGSRYRARPVIAMRVGAFALALSTAYLFYALSIHHRTEAFVANQLLDEGIAAENVKAYPTILQPYLRRVVVRTPGTVRVGFVSMWKPQRIEWSEFSEDKHPFVQRLRDTEDGQVFEWFAMGQTVSTVRRNGDEIVIELDDIRYGFPDSPRHGIWGIRGRFNEDGTLNGPVEYFNRPRPASIPDLLRTLLKQTFAPKPEE
ncbi:MAG: metal-dependent hydrolase [Candidatus Hydrogenedentes bacterium]|nr:metal-dependent hydrolase [Candidatus Hydrogenedentota bacterium]